MTAISRVETDGREPRYGSIYEVSLSRPQSREALASRHDPLVFFAESEPDVMLAPMAVLLADAARSGTSRTVYWYVQGLRKGKTVAPFRPISTTAVSCGWSCNYQKA